MATKQRSRTRRPHGARERVRYVAPVLDPNWNNPYSPSTTERLANDKAIRAFALRRRLPQSVIVGVLALALIVGVVAAAWLPAIGVVMIALYAWDLHRYVSSYAERGDVVGAALLGAFTPGGTPADRLRLVTVLDRLAATFGVDHVSAFVVEDHGYNAALVPDGAKYSLFVTSALMQDFELIELEGVVAHCLARQRLGLLEREAVAAVTTASGEARRVLAGAGQTYRADEVAAASIRYPLGLAGALRKCARQQIARDSFFATSAYDQWRWVFFNPWSDRGASDLSDLDDPELRARALEEW